MSAPTIPLDSHAEADAHPGGAVEGLHSRDSQAPADSHGCHAVAGPSPATTDQTNFDAHRRYVGGGGPDGAEFDHRGAGAHEWNVEFSAPPAPAKPGSAPKARALMLAAQAQPEPTTASSSPRTRASARAAQPHSGRGPFLADPILGLAADVLDDLETVRIANENRLRQLTKTETDKDGKNRGFGLPLEHPDVARLAALVDALREAEHRAELNLKRLMRLHPLGPWVKSVRGVGEKQAARLLAAIGDPYWNTLHDRPRTVSELWAFCGYVPGQKRRKGQRFNWSPAAKKWAEQIAEKCGMQLVKPCHSIKDEAGYYAGAEHIEGCACSPYRLLYDQARAQYADTVHPQPCDGCTPKGKPPAPVGSPRTRGHQEQMAYRRVAKELLKGLWREAKRLHEDLPGDHGCSDAQNNYVAGEPNSLGAKDDPMPSRAAPLGS